MLIALIDEYKRAAIDYKIILKKISLEDFIKIRDEKTEDSDCKSIQTVTTHIIQSGYTYANYIQSVSNTNWFEYDKKINTTKFAIQEINEMLNFTENSFKDIWHKTNEEIEKTIIKSRWNVTYDVEQLLEHAIVHILRHRRQIEFFLKEN